MMATRRATAREESWNSVHHSEISNDTNDDLLVMPSQESEPQLMTVGDVQRVLRPLQSTAERVGKQVEQFAETLDKLGSKRDRPATDCRDVLPLVHQYEKIASETVKKLRKHHESERQERLKKTWKRRLQATSDRSTTSEDRGFNPFSDHGSTNVDDLENWENERQTWQLLRLMLEVEYPLQEKVKSIPEMEERFRFPKDTPKIHQFSPERDVWNSYLESEHGMWEKHIVVEWLKTSADSVGQDIDTVVEQLEMGADRGSGLLAHSWLYSKEEIKQAKRLRSWPQPLDPDSPGIDTTLVSQGGEALVTQLDPDAFSRQGRNLKKEDVFFERAIWLACYEMMRRGHSWKSIREWCQERVEVWRALSMRGDPRLLESSQSTKDVLSGWQARSIWRKMCAIAAKDGGIDEYENAVYGILSGDQISVEKVACGWDDYLFSVYNAQLLQGFESFTRRKFANSLPWEVLDKFGGMKFTNAVKQPATSGEAVWKELLERESTREEARSPIKMIQGSIIAKRVQRFLNDQGALLDRVQAQEAIVDSSNLQIQTQSPTTHIGTDDYDLLRVLAHIAFVYQVLDPWPQGPSPVENIIVAYVDYLGKAGKQQLVPLYASRLSSEGATVCMASQLPIIVDASERRIVMNLMKHYKLDVPLILSTQLTYIVDNAPSVQSYETSVPPRRILVQNRARNEIPHIEPDFIGEEILGEDLDLINGMEWYLLLDGHWNETMLAGGFVYKHFLRTGAWAAARELASRVPFSTISKNKTGDLIGETVDLGLLSDDETEEGFRTRGSGNSRHQRSVSQKELSLKKEALLDSSSTFRDLEMLVLALNAIEGWEAVETILRSQEEPRNAKEIKRDLQNAYELVVATVEPVLDKEWLRMPLDETENVELHNLKRQYLPEIIIAYNTILAVTAQFLTRDILLKCMELAAHVASENADLASIVVEAGRMSELVDALGMSSRTILRADEVGIKSGKKSRRGQGNVGLGIWTVRRAEIIKNLEIKAKKNKRRAA